MYLKYQIMLYICCMEIGQQVKWVLNSVGNIECIGVFLQQMDTRTSEVICHYMNDKKCVAKLQVETIKLKQI